MILVENNHLASSNTCRDHTLRNNTMTHQLRNLLYRIMLLFTYSDLVIIFARRVLMYKNYAALSAASYFISLVLFLTSITTRDNQLACLINLNDYRVLISHQLI